MTRKVGITNCACCGKAFMAKARRRDDGSERIQTTCSFKCAVRIRDIFGEKNPNYRHGNKRVCDYCGQSFIGFRPSTGPVFCGLRCRSMVHRGNNKRDGNESELVKLARELGAEWIEAPPLDGWICHQAVGFMPVEIKRPQRKGRKHEFTPAQKKFFALCEGKGLPYWIWRTSDDVLASLGARRTA